MRPINRALALSLCVFGLAVSAIPARADLTPVTAPTVIFTGPGTEFFTDIAFDSVNKVYLATWGTFEARPCLGRFLDVNGAPIGGVFTLSDGAAQCGWTRVSAGGGRFMVTFSKRVGGTDRAPIKYQLARFIQYSNGQPVIASNEIFVDNTGDVDSDGGNAYNPATGNFMATWFKNRSFPQSFVRRISPDGTTGDIVQLTDNSDGLPEPEIACNPTNNVCVTVGVSFDAAHNGAGATWMRTIDGTTGATTGPMTLLDAGVLQENQSVAYSAASGQFVLAWVRLRQRIVGYLVSGAGTPSGGQYAIKSPFDQNCNIAFGQIVSSLRYNSATSTSALAMVNNCGVAYVQELDSVGQPTANSFQPITGLGTTDPQPAMAANTVDGQFLAIHNYHYATPYSRVFQAQLRSDGGGGGGNPPPPTLIDLTPTGAPNGSWFLAEGVANPSPNGFKTFYEVENPNNVDVQVRAYFANEVGTVQAKTFNVGAHSRMTVPLYDTVGVGSFGTVFQSLTPGADIAVERSVYWGPNLEGSTDATAVHGANPVWYFAEGSRGAELFNNYFLLFNPTQSPTVVTGHYYRADGQVFGHTYNVGPQQRYTVDANAIPELAGTDFSATFTSNENVPFVAERSMYWNWQGPANWWIGGHATMGSPVLNNVWLFAEGNAASNFESFFLLLNSNPFPIEVDGDYMTEFAGRQLRHYTIPANTRMTVYLNGELGNIGPTAAVFSTANGSPFLAERSIYWGNRVEGTNTVGSPIGAGVWDLPEGSTGNSFDTYEMVLNPNNHQVSINVTLYIEGFDVFTLPPVTLEPFSRKTLVMKDLLNQLAQIQGVPPGVRTSAFATRISTTSGDTIVVEHAVYWNFVDGVTYWRSGGGSMGIPR